MDKESQLPISCSHKRLPVVVLGYIRLSWWPRGHMELSKQPRLRLGEMASLQTVWGYWGHCRGEHPHNQFTECVNVESSERSPLPADGRRFWDPYLDIMGRESLSWRSPANLSPWSTRYSGKDREERLQESEGMEETRKHSPLNQSNRAPMGSQRLRLKAQGMHGFAPGLHMSCGSQLGGFVEVLTVGAGRSLTLWPAHSTLFLILGCCVQLLCESFFSCLTVFILSCLAVVPWMPVLFRKGEKGSGLGRERRGKGC